MTDDDIKNGQPPVPPSHGENPPVGDDAPIAADEARRDYGDDEQQLDGDDDAYSKFESIHMEQAIHDYIEDRMGGTDGLVLYKPADDDTPGSKGVKAIGWHLKWKRWLDIRFGGNRAGSISSDIYYGQGYYRDRMAKQFGPGTPRIKTANADRRAIENEMMAQMCGDETALATFDTLNPAKVHGYAGKGKVGVIARFEFGDRDDKASDEGGIYEIHITEFEDDKPKHKLVRIDGDNKREYRLRSKIAPGHIASKEEWLEGRAEALRFLASWFPYYNEVETDGDVVRKGADGKPIPVDPNNHPAFNDKLKKGEGNTTRTGNYSTQDRFNHDAFVAVPATNVVPIAIEEGIGGSGKSTLNAQWVEEVIGTEAGTHELDAHTFTTGSEAKKGNIRANSPRKKLLGKRYGVALEAGDRNSKINHVFCKALADIGTLVDLDALWENTSYADIRGVFKMCPNSMPRNVEGMSAASRRRFRVYKYREEFDDPDSDDDKAAAAKAEIESKFSRYGPIFRRELLETIRVIVEEHQCRLPKQHPLLREDWKAASEQSQFGVDVELYRCFKPAAKLKHAAAVFSETSRDRRPRMKLGSVGSRSNEDYKLSRPLEHPPADSKAQPPEQYDGALLALKVINKAHAARFEATLEKLTNSFVRDWHYEADSQGYFDGIIHTDHLCRVLRGFYKNREDCEEVLACLYYRKGGFAVSEVLTERQGRILDGEVVEGADDEPSAVAADSATPAVGVPAQPAGTADDSEEASRQAAEVDDYNRAFDRSPEAGSKKFRELAVAAFKAGRTADHLQAAAIAKGVHRGRAAEMADAAASEAGQDEYDGDF